MTEQEQIEADIRKIMAADMSSIDFGNKVFGQFTGLFARLGPTQEKRREIILTPLWKEAQARMRELERLERAPAENTERLRVENNELRQMVAEMKSLMQEIRETEQAVVRKQQEHEERIANLQSQLHQTTRVAAVH